MHWLSRELVLSNDGVWRTDLLGGGRVLGFVDRLRNCRTLQTLAAQSSWEVGEGWVFGNAGDGRPAAHVVGKQNVQAEAFCGWAPKATADNVSECTADPYCTVRLSASDQDCRLAKDAKEAVGFRCAS